MRLLRSVSLAAAACAATFACTTPAARSAPATTARASVTTRAFAGGPAVPDAQVDRLVDPRLPPAERAIVRRALLELPPVNRARGVIVRTRDGRLHASSLALLAMSSAKSRYFGAGPVERPATTSASDERTTANPKLCPKTRLGGFSAGAFRRVYAGCTGYTSANTTFGGAFSGNPAVDCTIASAPNHDADFVLLGAYSTTTGAPNGPAIDGGLQYVSSGAASSYQGVISIGGTATYGTDLPCGVQDYTITLGVTAGPAGTSDVVLIYDASSTSGAGGDGTPIIVEVPAATFAADGSNFVFYRQTLIAQSTPNDDRSHAWFGFATNANGGPDLAQPEIAYGQTLLVNTSTGSSTFLDAAHGYPQRNPNDFSNLHGALCSIDGADGLGAFADYEGIDLNDRRTSGVLPGVNCYGNDS